MRSDALITCVIAGVQYLLHPQKLGTIDATIDPDALVPVTLLTTSQILDGNVDALLQLYDVYDDVFIPEFGGVLVEKTQSGGSHQQAGRGEGVKIHKLAENTTLTAFEKLPSGPYFLYGPNLYQAWRLYDDEFEAFSTGVVPEDVESPVRFRPLTSSDKSGLHKAIAVPSKLYHPPPGAAGKESPLSGVRIAVSDAAAVKGVPRTLSSRAWTQVHPEVAEDSAKLVEDLVSLGAVVIGKTKTAHFTAGRDWIDASAPLSPRGDQYQRLGGSSAGASVALTGYEWLRLVVADDDRGSVLDLAAQEGSFTLRTSPELLSAEGTQLSAQSFSGLSLSARSIDHLLDIGKALSKGQHSKQTTKLIRLVDLESGLEGHENSLYEEFVKCMEDTLGVKSEPLNLTALWKDEAPTTSDETSLRRILDATTLSYCQQFYRAFSDFRAAYRKLFQRRPYIEPVVQHLWDIGANVTEDEEGAAGEILEDFRRWFHQNILPAKSTAAIILPMKQKDVVYRDEPLSPPTSHESLTASRLASMLQLPALIAPFAQLPFDSRFGEAEEYRPVSAAIIGPDGSDVALIELVQKAYRQAQWRARVDTGRRAFPTAKNPRNVDDRVVADLKNGKAPVRSPQSDHADELMSLEL